MINGPHHKLSALFKLAVLSGVPAAVRHHLNKGDDIEARDGSGATPLIIAAGKGRSAVVELLLEQGADPRAVDGSGLDALAHATRKEAWGIVEALTRALEIRLRRGQMMEAVPAFAPRVDPDVVADISGPLALVTVDPWLEGSGLAGNGMDRSPGVVLQAGCSELSATVQDPVAEPVVPVEPMQEREDDGEPGQTGVWDEAEAVHPSGSRPEMGAPVRDASVFLPGPEEKNGACQWGEAHQGPVMVQREDPQAGAAAAFPVPALQLSGGPVSPPDAMVPATLADTSLGEDAVELTGLDDWEAETPPVAPVGDPRLAALAWEVQHHIASHTPVDDAEGWDDIEIDLPARAKVIAALSGDAEDPFRPLLAEGLQTGMLARQSILNACTGKDGDVDPDLERALGIVAEDLGFRIVDEEVFTEDRAWQLSDDDEVILDEAIIFLEELVSNRGDPFRLYQREMKPLTRLSAQEEVEVAGAIESAGREAVSALSRWPAGISLVLEAADSVRSGHVDAELYCSGPEPAQEEEPSGEHGTRSDEGAHEDLDEVAALFLAAVAELKEAGGDVSRREMALERARLSRGFLLTLADTAQCMDDGREFALAIRRQSIARERMIVCNLRLAFSIARKFLWSGLPMDDLIQEANIGLMKAVERYDWRKGFRFSTYATWWIRQGVSRAVANHARLIRTPVHFQDAGWKLMRSREGAFSSTGQVESEVQTAERMGLTVGKVRDLIAQFEEAVSLEDPCLPVPVLEDLHERLTDDEASKMVERTILRQNIMSLIEILDEKARNVVVYRFGLSGNDAMTLEEIGNALGVTRERIRQIEAKALRKLERHLRLVPQVRVPGNAPGSRKRESS